VAMERESEKVAASLLQARAQEKAAQAALKVQCQGARCARECGGTVRESVARRSESGKAVGVVRLTNQ
jgi:hypothetical protein